MRTENSLKLKIPNESYQKTIRHIGNHNNNKFLARKKY